MQVRERAAELRAMGADAVAVGFSPGPPLAALGRHLRWPYPFLTDPERVLYARLGLGRARLRDVYTPATLRQYAAAAARGTRISKPVEDTRQLGGDAIVLDGMAVRIWRPRSPDDRPTVADLLAGVQAAVTGGASA